MSVVPEFLISAIDMKPDITTKKIENYPKIMKKVVNVEFDLIEKRKT